jgi:hypothetical protein
LAEGVTDMPVASQTVTPSAKRIGSAAIRIFRRRIVWAVILDSWMELNVQSSTA